MKVIKKITAIMLSIMMVLGMSSVVSAAGTTSGMSSAVKGKITISNAVPGQTYTIYKILDLESYDATNGHYAYKVASGWDGFITGSGEGAAYLKETEGYVNWNGEQTDARKAEFAKKALAYAKNQVSSTLYSKTASSTTTGTTSKVVFENLDLGYYLVDSPTGTICSVDTTNNEVDIEEKNVAPTVEKKVQEDSTSAWGPSNTADIGDAVNFTTTITAQAGAQNYVLHDKMSEGLSFADSSVQIQWTKKSGGTTTPLVSGTDYDVTTTDLETMNPKCTFHVTFKENFCDKLAKDDTIVITYSATLNEQATVGTTGNKNETWLKYGESDKLETAHKTTTTKTYEVPVFKYTLDTDGTTKTGLPNAEFTLSKNADGTDPIKLMDITGSATAGKYRVEKTGTVTKITTPATGNFTIQGLDAGTYYLTETKQPDGYNKLTSPIIIIINEEDGKITVGGTDVTQVEVENKSGSLLPSTGGRGTTLFYILGAILVVGSGVVLITKKRMK